MNYKILKYNFIKNCKKNGFIVIEAVAEYETGVLYLGTEDFIDFCLSNNLKNIFLIDVYDEGINSESINLASIKNKLTNFFNEKIDRLSSMYLFNNISKSFYEPILINVLNEVDEELSSYANKIENTQIDNPILYVDAMTPYNGVIIAAHIYNYENDDEYEESNDTISEKEVLNRYANKIMRELDYKRNEAIKENMRITNIRRTEKLNELKEKIENDSSILTLKAQKNRNEYADRIYSSMIANKGNEWLTKKAIREIVDQVYYSKVKMEI